MGKKNKDKKGKGKEKTEQKTDKKAAKRAKKELAEKGEEDIEKMIAEFVAKDKQLKQVREEKCPPPSPRSNMTLVAHPDRDELIMFGGEYYTGKNMYLYNDLFYYNIRKNEWCKVTSPNAPPPRSAHQAVVVAGGGGQMWVFGGEFSSHSQNQFYHYRDLWRLSLKDKTWELFKPANKQGPTARSGHRMVAFKNQLMVFGGFHNNNRDCRYYNDLWAFDVGTYTWSQIEASGTAPSPRSGCVLCPTVTGSRLVLYGGYSMERVKRDVDQGTPHSDMFALQPEGKAEDGRVAKWRWLNVKQSGTKPSPRSSMAAVVAPGNHAVVFGGVQDEEEDEEQLEGTFFNDMYTLDLDKGQWFTVQLRGSKQTTDKKRRRKMKQGDDNDDEEMEADDDDEEVAMEVNEHTLDRLALSTPAAHTHGAGEPDTLTHNAGDIDTHTNNTRDPVTDSVGVTVPNSAGISGSATDCNTEGDPDSTRDGDSPGQANPAGAESSVFTVTVGPQSSSTAADSPVCQAGASEKLFVPCARMSPCMAVKGGVLYLYGGKFEVGDKEVTLSDFHALDLGKLDVWRTIITPDIQTPTWAGSDSDSDSGEEEASKSKRAGLKREAAAADDEDSDDDDDDDDDDLTFEDAPVRGDDEGLDDYFERTQDYWLTQARDIMEGDGIKLSHRKLLKIAREICTESAGN